MVALMLQLLDTDCPVMRFEAERHFGRFMSRNRHGALKARRLALEMRGKRYPIVRNRTAIIASVATSGFGGGLEPPSASPISSMTVAIATIAPANRVAAQATPPSTAAAIWALTCGEAR